MTDHDDPGRVEEPRSEGVRIIGAQEAAEAAGRPDVARRRRRGEKRYGDRPDQPEPDEALPTVRISTSDEGDDPADRFGEVPVVRPRSDEPRWADDEPGTRGYGHARALPAEDEYELEPADEPDPYAPADEVPDWGTEQPGAEDPFAAPDDSFVLPHWTEPPTGQVPKVVIGDDVVEDEPTGSFGSAPRWRDEGERHVETDFDDLLDDAPRLGALGGGDDPLDDPEDDFFFDSEADRDPIEAFAPDDDVMAIDERRSTRRTRTRTRPPAQEEEDDGYYGGPPSDDGGVGGDRNLVTAIAVGVVLVAVGLLCFKLGGLATTVLACLVVGAAAFEYFGTVETRGFQPAGLLGLVSTVGLMIATYTSGLDAYPIVLTLTVVLGLLWYLWVQPGEHSVRNLGVTLLGVMWIGFLGSFATLFLGLGKVLEDAGASSNIGIGVIIAAVIVAVSHDIGAYFIGRYFGRTPLSAASPNKTLEGTAGGVIVAVVVTVVVVGFFGIAPIGGDIFRVFVFALLCAVVAPIGDLCESFVKRDLGIKDFGTILPGHGGVMDRFDALLFVLPTAYFVTLLFDIWG
ncbi:phosphatidate cytidylyltransferase [Dermatobacter hominis]|uniref:phosphatidate cytidylyltransferase n=1 Tax=Dermatobacter hominis TaxID=2884263 RepID=UPI001D10B100|nr:CDP-archaeol synthase [Dermatobacter hominis]UDY36860.1 phosphatidate cytidylyltransferase [Dermatobacter hominis]